MKKPLPPLKTKTAKAIIKEFDLHVQQNSTLYAVYENWYVGVTNNPTARKSNHKQKNKVYFWLHKYCRSKNIALAIEQYYHSKGMLETGKQGNVVQNSFYVYIYKKHPTIID